MMSRTMLVGPSPSAGGQTAGVRSFAKTCLVADGDLVADMLGKWWFCLFVCCFGFLISDGREKKKEEGGGSTNNGERKRGEVITATSKLIGRARGRRTRVAHKEQGAPKGAATQRRRKLATESRDATKRTSTHTHHEHDNSHQRTKRKASDEKMAHSKSEIAH